MKTFELSSRNTKNGRRKFKLVLCEVFPESTIDEEKQVGTEFNRNGISWIDTYVRKQLDTIPGMFLRAEFLDEDRTELCGHGETGVVDGMPTFENAVSVGIFTKGYIESVETDDGIKEYCIGEGEIDALCYSNFVRKLAKDLSDDSPPYGSVEILKSDGNDAIIYKYGYVPEGRIPTDFQFSGYALLGVQPADDAACLVELNKNNREEDCTMNENEIKALVTQAVNEMSDHINEINKCKNECAAQVSEANAKAEAATAEKNEAIGNAAQLEAAYTQCQNDLSEAYKKIDQLYAEMKVLREELAAAQAKERIGELNEQIKDFSDDEKDYAKDEIDAFKNDPVNSEINSVVNKIWEGIGKKSKADAEANAAMIAEQNAAKEVEDIFAGVDSVGTNNEDENIF